MGAISHPAAGCGHLLAAIVWLGFTWCATSGAAHAQESPPESSSESAVESESPDPASTAESETPPDPASTADSEPAPSESVLEEATSEAAIPADAPPIAASQESATMLDEMVVTATRRERSVREIPVSIDAFSGDELRDMGATTLAQILARSPGIAVLESTSPDGTQVVIRGSGANGNDFNRPFGLFYEDVPLLNPTIIGSQPDIDPFDLQTVEALKGPQGTLFGGSALVGAIRYVPKEPTYDRSYGEISYGFGTIEDSTGVVQHATAMLNVALLDTLAFRFAGSLRDTPGTIYDTFDAREDINATSLEQRRAVGVWTPWDTVRIKATYQDRESSSDSFSGSLITNDDGRLTNHVLRGPRDDSLQNLDLTIVRADIDWFEAFTITLNSSRLKKDGRFFQDVSWTSPGAPTDKASQDKLFLTDQMTHELRLVSQEPSSLFGWSPLQGWDYVLGVFYMESDQAVDINAFPAHAGAMPTDGDVHVLAFLRANAVEEAIYFDATRGLFDKLFEVNLGGRLFRQETPASVAAFVTLYTPSTPDAPVNPLGEPGADTLTERGFNPKFALTWHAAKDLAVYTSATKGFRFGGVNADPFATGEPPPFYESDSLWNYEIGARTTWQDRTLQLDVTGYYIDWKNKQTPQNTTAEVSTQYLINIGGSRIQGAEFSARKLFANGLSFMVNGGLVSSRTTEDFETSGAGFVPAGSREPVSPRETGSATAGYRSGWEGGWTFDTTLAWMYRGEALSDFANHVPLPAYDVFNLSFVASHQTLLGSPKLTFNVLNLEDDRSLAVAGSNEFEEDNPDRLVLARTVTPRTVLLNLQLSF